MDRPTNEDKKTAFLSFLCQKSEVESLLTTAKESINDLFASLKVTLVEFLLSAEREQIAGPLYNPLPGLKKWGSQAGSVYVAGEKIKIEKPRLRKEKQEIPLSIYEKLKDPSTFSKKILEKALRGISCRDYPGSLEVLLGELGISKSSVSRHLKCATAKKLQELQGRILKDLNPFALFIDGYHIAGKVFIVALLIDLDGKKHVLGFWEGATENHEICLELLADLEKRGLHLDDQVLYITDGGKGIIKALKKSFGSSLLHQRCYLHKDRNIQNHLAKKYRQLAHKKFMTALNCVDYKDAQEELLKFKNWLETINHSASESLNECIDELLTVHRLKVPPLLRKTLLSTNPIESMFSMASRHLHRITHMKKGHMAQRWMGTVLLYAEERFRSVKGYLSISEVRDNIIALKSEKKEKIA